MKLREAVRKYSDDEYKRAELVKGEVVVRRGPFFGGMWGFMENGVRSGLSDHSWRYRLGKIYGAVGYITDPNPEGETMRCSPITFTRADRPIELGEMGYVLTPPHVVFEFINAPEFRDDVPEDQKIEDWFKEVLFKKHANEDDDNYWPDKLEDYRRFGVELMWIVDLHNERVHEYRQPDWQPVTRKGDDLLDAGDLIPGFRCTVNQLFDPSFFADHYDWDAPLDNELLASWKALRQKLGLEPVTIPISQLTSLHLMEEELRQHNLVPLRIIKAEPDTN
jgi:Uma2 family endonuclease